MPTLVLFDADNGFSENDVLHAVKALPAQDCIVCAAGAHGAAHRMGVLAVGLSKAGIRQADLRIVLSGEDAADDALVDFALQWRQRIEGPLCIQIFTHDKALIERLGRIASVQVGCSCNPQKAPAAGPQAQGATPAIDGVNLTDAEFFKRFLAALNVKNQSVKKTLHHAAFSKCVCDVLGLAGAGKATKKSGYAYAIARLKQAGIIATNVKAAPFAVKLNMLRQVGETAPAKNPPPPALKHRPSILDLPDAGEDPGGDTQIGIARKRCAGTLAEDEALSGR